MNRIEKEEVNIPIGKVTIKGNLEVPEKALAIVVFAHGSGSSRFSPRNQFVAKELVKVGLATLLMDLLTEEEEKIDMQTAHLRFDIDLLANRLIGATAWLKRNSKTNCTTLVYL